MKQKQAKKTPEQKEVINNLEESQNSREEVITFLETILKCYLMQNKMELREKDLKY